MSALRDVAPHLANGPQHEGINMQAGNTLNEWLSRLNQLVTTVEDWAKQSGWSTRRIDKQMRDSEVGAYVATALLLQDEITKVLLEPIARSAPGADGVVDLYLMPEYDDIASLYFYEKEWRLHYMFSGTPTVAMIREAESLPLTKDSLLAVLEEMKKNAAATV